MKRVESKLFSFLFLILSSLALNACGIGSTSHPRYMSGTGNGAFGSFPITENPDYQCPTEPNLLPKFDRWLDGTFYFYACAHRTDPNRVVFHGTTESSNVLRIYPALHQSANEVYVFEDPQDPGTILDFEIVAQPNGAFGNFAIPNNQTFNAVFIIEAQNQAQMDICLATRDYYTCPDFAYGRFR